MNRDGSAVILTSGVNELMPAGASGQAWFGTRAGKLASGGSYDTEREPDSPRRVPSDDVAHEMNAQVDPAEPDEQNEACKERNRRPAWRMGKGDTGEQVSQKSVSDQGTHHLARSENSDLGNP
jgi:hypothetical protein